VEGDEQALKEAHARLLRASPGVGNGRQSRIGQASAAFIVVPISAGELRMCV